MKRVERNKRKFASSRMVLNAWKFYHPCTVIERLAIIKIEEKSALLESLLIYQYDESFILQFLHGFGSRFWRLYNSRIISSENLFFYDSRDRLRPKRGTSRQNHLPELSRLNCLENQSVCPKSSARLFFIIISFKWLKSKIYEVTDINGWSLPNRQFA